MVISKVLVVLDIHFTGKFKFLHLTLNYFKMIISNITSPFLKQSFQNGNLIHCSTHFSQHFVSRNCRSFKIFQMLEIYVRMLRSLKIIS